MKENIDKIKSEFYSQVKEVGNKIEIIGDPISSCILIKCQNVDELINNLKKNGFFVPQQKHLKEDWCQNEFIKVNLGVCFTSEKIKCFCDIIKKN